MTGTEYQSALTILSLTPDQAAIWLGIGRSTAYRYLKTGCEGAVARCLVMATGVMMLQRWEVCEDGQPWFPMGHDLGDYVRRSDLTAAVGLPVSAEPPAPNRVTPSNAIQGGQHDQTRQQSRSQAHQS